MQPVRQPSGPGGTEGIIWKGTEDRGVSGAAIYRVTPDDGQVLRVISKHASNSWALQVIGGPNTVLE